MNRNIRDLRNDFSCGAMKLPDAQKFKEAQYDYNRKLERWGSLGEMCMTCKTRHILPQYTTSSLPIRPVWDGVTKQCIVCTADGWDWYSNGMRVPK